MCKSVGQAEKAYGIFLEIRRQSLPMDAYVYGALISAFSEATQTLNSAHERKEQFVLMERAFAVVQDAKANNVHLGDIPWNSLLVCVGRCGQLRRAFAVLDSMQESGVKATAYTFSALMEACIQAKQPVAALKLFERALHEVCDGAVCVCDGVCVCVCVFGSVWQRGSCLSVPCMRCLCARVRQECSVLAQNDRPGSVAALPAPWTCLNS